MKKIVIFVFLMIIKFDCHSQINQNWYLNYEKYWWYRYRLVNDFMKVGPNCGESIPAYRRARGYVTNDPVKNGYLDWGDGTQILGKYLAMTALEYRILDNNSWNTYRSCYENLMAQKAFNRLDLNAESYCSSLDATYPCNANPPSSDLNGFFIRDDVPENFVLENIKHFNRNGIKMYNPVGQTSDLEYYENCPLYKPFYILNKGVNSAYSERKLMKYKWANRYCDNPPRYATEESQDQVSEMYTGLGLTKKYMPSNFMGVDLQGNAADHWIRMVKFIDVNSSGTFFIRNPTTGHCIYGVVPQDYYNNNICFSGGGFCTTGAVGMTNGLWKYNLLNGTALLMNLQTNSNLFFNAMWQNMQLFGLTNNDASFFDNYACFSNNWFDIISFGPPFYTPSIYGIGNNTTYEWIWIHSSENNWRSPHLPLIYRMLHPYLASPNWVLPFPKPSYDYENLLNKATFCGNFSFDNHYSLGNHSDWEWSSQDRLGFSHQRGDNNNCEYNGVDYMELFNLYVLNSPSYLQWIINPYYDINYDVNYPHVTPTHIYGDMTHPLTLNYLEYISLVDNIAWNGHVTFRGAKVIDFMPGFNTDIGADFTAYIEDYDCRTNEYHYALEGANNTPIMYNPKGGSYQEKMAVNDENETNDYNSFISDNKNIDLQQQIRENDSLIYLVQHSEYDDILKEMLPEVFDRKIDFIPQFDIRITISPNPSNGLFTITFPNFDDYQLQVYDLVGKELYSEQISNTRTKELNLSQLISGTYLVIVKNNTNSYVQKISIIK